MMPTVLLHLVRLGDAPFVDERVDDLELLAAHDRLHVHTLTADPVEADVLLFPQCHMVDWRLRAIRRHPLAKRHWDKVMVYDERDRPWRSFPGIYVSMPSKSFDTRAQRAWGYLRTPDVLLPSSAPDLLFSFVGSDTAACRKPLLDLRHPDAIVEEATNFMFWDEQAPGFRERRARYAEILARSRFVLCPRGRGTSSLRLYEVLAAARVPVIISDEWVAPPGPDWDACSLRWPEGRIQGLAEFLEERNKDWEAMSKAAATAEASFFAPDVAFHRVADLLDGIRRGGGRSPGSPVMEARGALASLRERLQ